MTGEPVIALLDTVWTSIRILCSSFGDADWQAPTECPGWSVKDNLSHMIATERMLAARPSAPQLTHYPDHVRNAIGQRNEDAVAARRPVPGASVLDEFNEITAVRLDALSAMSPIDFDRDGPSPIGEVPYRDFMRVRAFDCWVHEQDVRRAVARPGHLAGPVVDAALAWHRRNLGYVVGKRAQAPDGAAVRFAVTGVGEALAEDATVVVAGGRASIASGVVPSTTLHTDIETYNALLCGRRRGADEIAAGRVAIEGDRTLGRAIAENMGYVF